MEAGQRIGKFRIARAAGLDSGIREVLRKIHDKVIVFRCEMLYAEGALEYVAMCDEFDEVLRGDHVPRYNVLVHISPKGEQTIQFIKEET